MTLVLATIFLDMTLKAQNDITNKLVGLHHTKIVYIAKETINKMKGHPVPSRFTP